MPTRTPPPLARPLSGVPMLESALLAAAVVLALALAAADTLGGGR